MKTIRIDGLTFTCDEAHADAIEQAIARLGIEAQKKLDAALASLKTAEGGLTTITAKFDEAKANLGKNWLRVVKKFDAMKTRMATCDECAGAGKVMDGAGEKKCDYCDGSGKVLAHEAMKGEPVVDEMEEEADALLGKPEGDEPAKEVELEHKDRLDKAIVGAATKRAASVGRRIARDTAARVTLETGARKHLGAEAKLDGKTADDVKRLVLGKTDPGLKLDGKDAGFVATAYEIAMARPAPEAGNGGGGNGNARTDGDEFDVAKAQRAYHDNLKKATKPTA